MTKGNTIKRINKIQLYFKSHRLQNRLREKHKRTNRLSVNHFSFDMIETKFFFLT